MLSLLLLSILIDFWTILLVVMSYGFDITMSQNIHAVKIYKMLYLQLRWKVLGWIIITFERIIFKRENVCKHKVSK